MQIEPFAAGHVAGAAALVSRFLAKHLAGPVPPPVSDAREAARLIEADLMEGSSGVVAVDGRDLRGFHLAALRGEGRDRSAWSGMHAHAADDPSTASALYAALAEEWVGAGCGHHYVVTTPGDAGAWLALSFGHESVHGIRTTSWEGAPPAPEGFAVRRASPEDVDRVEPLAPLIGRAHQASPVFAYVEEEFFAGLSDGHLELLRDEAAGYFVAGDGRRLLGFAAFRPVPAAERSMVKPAGTVELIVAATIPEARGRGVMRALVQRGLEWARGAGYGVCVTDWRSANPAPSGAWPALGFTPWALRLHRVVDPRALPPVAHGKTTAG